MSNSYFTNSNPVVKQTLARASQVNANLDSLEAAFDKLPDKVVLDTGRVTYALDTGAADVYAVALHKTATSYYTGMHITMKVATTNTGASTLDVDGIGAKTVKIMNGTDPQAGDLTAGDIVDLVYDGTNFVIISVVRSIINGQAAMSDAEIKTAYENNADTNAFTDAQQTKVNYLTVTGAVDLGRPLPFRRATLTHTTGTISIDLSAGDYFEFVADEYVSGTITLVGADYHASNGTYPLPGTPQKDDLVIAFGFRSVLSGVVSTAGYTQLTTHSTPDGQLQYKVLGGTPDTEIVTTAGDFIVAVFRSIDTGTPFDATKTESDETTGTPANIDPAAITTVTDGAMVVPMAFADTSTDHTLTAISGYTIAADGFDTSSDYIAMWYKEVATAGSEDPGSTGVSEEYWWALTIALRPAAPSGEADYTVNLSNIPGAGEDILPKILLVETKTDTGTWTFNNVDQWIGGSAPTMASVGLHAIRYWVGNGEVTAEYLGGP